MIAGTVVADPLLGQEEIRLLTTGWQSAWAARAAAAAAAAWLLALAVRRLGVRRRGLGIGLLQGAAAVGLLLFAALPQRVVDAAIGIDYVVRVRAIAVGLSVLVLAIAVEAIRDGRLSERYALLWLATAGTVIAAALWPKGVALLRACTGMSYTAALVCVLVAFLVLVLFHVSIVLSRMQADRTRLVQRVALLEVRVRELEDQAACHQGAASQSGIVTRPATCVSSTPAAANSASAR